MSELRQVWAYVEPTAVDDPPVVQHILKHYALNADNVTLLPDQFSIENIRLMDPDEFARTEGLSLVVGTITPTEP